MQTIGWRDSLAIPVQQRAHGKRMAKPVDVRTEDAGRNIQRQLRQQIVPKRIADAVRADGRETTPGEQKARANADIASRRAK